MGGACSKHGKKKFMYDFVGETRRKENTRSRMEDILK
jgi:hypothetical protein